jgi:glutamate 5-kinase
MRGEKNIVVKVGSAAITTDSDINTSVIQRFAFSISQLIKNYGKNITIVTSGAIALGRKKENKHYGKENILEQQYYASIGQHSLMAAYEDEFKKFDLAVGQFLVTHRDFFDKTKNSDGLTRLDILIY